MTDEQLWETMENKERQFDEELDSENPETALTTAEIDLLKDTDLARKKGAEICEVIEEARADPLSLIQVEAASLVAMGISDSQVALLMGISRQSVNSWKNHNFFFMEEVKKNRAEMMESYKMRYRTMVDQAMDVMREGLVARDLRMRMRAATFILRSLKLE